VDFLKRRNPANEYYGASAPICGDCHDAYQKGESLLTDEGNGKRIERGKSALRTELSRQEKEEGESAKS